MVLGNFIISQEYNSCIVCLFFALGVMDSGNVSCELILFSFKESVTEIQQRLANFFYNWYQFKKQNWITLVLDKHQPSNLADFKTQSKRVYCICSVFKHFNFCYLETLSYPRDELQRIHCYQQVCAIERFVQLILINSLKVWMPSESHLY